MPVYKYRSIEETPEPWEVYGDTRITGRLRAALSLTRLGPPLGLPRGVYKFRSFEELVADRERYEQERIDRIREPNSRE
jgi:hypothetical protein